VVPRYTQERVSDSSVQTLRLPFWSYAKLLFNCWLVLPKFNGAAHVYGHFVRPMIEQNGSKAFENLVNKFKSSNPRRSILEEVEVERRARIQRESEARGERIHLGYSI